MKSIMVAAIVILFAQCGGGKTSGDTAFPLEQDPPFKVLDAYYQEWVAGIPEGGSGVNVYLSLGEFTSDVVVEKIYFRGMVTEAKISPQLRNQYIGYFKKEGKRDVVMDIDPMKEAKNTPPQTFPFTLEDNEAVLSYLEGDKVRYTKIPNLIEKELLGLPSTKPNDEN